MKKWWTKVHVYNILQEHVKTCLPCEVNILLQVIESILYCSAGNESYGEIQLANSK